MHIELRESLRNISTLFEFSKCRQLQYYLLKHSLGIELPMIENCHKYRLHSAKLVLNKLANNHVIELLQIAVFKTTLRKH